MVLERYQRDDPLQLASHLTETDEQVVLEGIRPLPQAAARLFADALNQARNSIEHTLFAEAAQRLNRPLTPEESKALQMPAFDSLEKFKAWANHKHLVSTGLLRPRNDLYERILRLQPFHRKEPGLHPLRLLVEHTNFAKHREPTIAFTRVAHFTSDSELTGVRLHERSLVKVGDVLKAVPRGAKELLSVWPQVAVQRPHRGEWQTLMLEVGEIADWVRTQALPILISGETRLPPIPPALDITIAYDNIDAAWLAAGSTPAAKRMQNRISGAQLRETVLIMMVELYGEQSRHPFSAWLDGMDDEAVNEKCWGALQSARRYGFTPSFYRAAEKWAAEAGI